MCAIEANVRAAFDLTATAYDRARRQLVPCFDAFYRAAVEALDFPAGAPLARIRGAVQSSGPRRVRPRWA